MIEINPTFIRLVFFGWIAYAFLPSLLNAIGEFLPAPLRVLMSLMF